MTFSPRTLAWSQRIAALALALFWISFRIDHSDLPPAIADFEWCFLVPDLLWIGVVLWVASRWLLVGDSRAGVATAAGGSSMVYLGLLDSACNFRHGQYTGSLARGGLNVTINVLCVLFGAANLWYAMRLSQRSKAELAEPQIHRS